MRTAAFGAIILLAFSACSTTNNSPAATDSPYVQPNQLMSAEITRRIDQIQYLHREELVDNLLWLVQSGEQSIPALLNGLKCEQPKTRSSCAWVLGMLKDRRTIPNLQAAMGDSEPAVRYECGRSLVLLGDLTPAPVLIEGLDSDRKEVRYMCHEALKQATGHDFGYDHLAVNQDQMRTSVLRWRQWWGEYSGDARFAQSYQERYGINTAQPAAPGGETMPVTPGNSSNSNSGTESGATSGANTNGSTSPNTNPSNATPNTGTGTGTNPSNATPTNPNGSKPSGGTGTASGYSSGVPTNPSSIPEIEIQVVPVSNPNTGTTGGTGNRSTTPNGTTPNGHGGN